MMNYAGSLYWEPISLLLTLCCLTQLIFKLIQKQSLLHLRWFVFTQGNWPAELPVENKQVIYLRLRAIQQCIPVGRHAILWYGGLVRCAKFLHILFRLSQFCFCRPFLSVKQKALCTNVSQYNHLQTTWIDGFFAAASARENGLRRVVEVPGGIDFTGTCNSDPAHMSSFDILGGLH